MRYLECACSSVFSSLLLTGREPSSILVRFEVCNFRHTVYFKSVNLKNKQTKKKPFLLLTVSAVYTSGFDFVCVVGPPVVDTYSPKPITLNGFVDGSFDDSVGYSITFSSRDDGSIVTNGDIARFGKIGVGSTFCQTLKPFP